MKLTFANNRKVNLRLLKEQLGKEFAVVQEPFTLTRIDGGVDYFGYVLDVPAATEEKSAVQAIAALHNPAMTDEDEAIAAAESAKDIEWRPRIRRILAHLLKDPQFITALKNALR